LEEGEDGAKIITLEEYGIKTPLMFLKSDGASTYAARGFGLHLLPNASF